MDYYKELALTNIWLDKQDSEKQFRLSEVQKKFHYIYTFSKAQNLHFSYILRFFHFI